MRIVIERDRLWVKKHLEPEEEKLRGVFVDEVYIITSKDLQQ